MAKKEAIKAPVESIKAESVQAADDQPPKMVRVIVPRREAGWFAFTEIEIEERVLGVHGKVLKKSEPDLFAIFKDQVIVKLREIFEI